MTQRMQTKFRIGVLALLLTTAVLLSECADACDGRSFAELWTNCAVGMKKTEANLSQVPVEMIPYYRKYDALFNPKFYVPAKFVPDLKGERDPRTVGICDVESFMFESENQQPNLHVEISREYWDKAAEDQREQLMFHELGHCLSGLDHARQSEFSIMTPRLQDPVVYIVLKFLFWFELRSRIKSATLTGGSHEHLNTF